MEFNIINIPSGSPVAGPPYRSSCGGGWFGTTVDKVVPTLSWWSRRSGHDCRYFDETVLLLRRGGDGRLEAALVSYPVDYETTTGGACCMMIADRARSFATKWVPLPDELTETDSDRGGECLDSAAISEYLDEVV